jgi:hypothetical protein
MKILGVDELFEISGELFISGKQIRAIDRFTDSVVEHLDELASDKCTHGISFNDECSECEIDAALQGEQDSLAAADEQFSRINP